MKELVMTIPEAAARLGVSTRTVRRMIKSGKIKAELSPGKYGLEYLITALPGATHSRQAASGSPSLDTDQTPVQGSPQVMDVLRELQNKNLALAAQLGVATERIRNLEAQVKLLAVAKKPWWRRLFGGSGAQS